MQLVPDDGVDDRPEVQRLLATIRARLPELEALLETCSGPWEYEDPIYRFYHQSWKVYAVQQSTTHIVEVLQDLLPGRPMNASFRAIVSEGTGRRFTTEANRDWLTSTRPMLEAFFHCRYFLEMAVRYGRRLEQPPTRLPSGWAALLYLFDLR